MALKEAVQDLKGFFECFTGLADFFFLNYISVFCMSA